MFGVWCWGTPGAQSDLTLPSLFSFSFPFLLHQYRTTNDSWNFCMQERTHVRCFWLHDDLSSKNSILQVLLPAPSCPWPWWVLALGGQQWGCLKSHRVGRQSPSWGAASPCGPPKFPALGVSQCHTLVSLLGSFLLQLQPRCSVPSCKDACLGFYSNPSVCLCFLQGKKKKRKRDKQPGETNGK